MFSAAPQHPGVGRATGIRQSTRRLRDTIASVYTYQHARVVEPGAVGVWFSVSFRKVFAQCRRALSNQLILLQGRIDRWDGTTNIVAERITAIGADIRMPSAHDWH
jgi:hypothetical protein